MAEHRKPYALTAGDNTTRWKLLGLITSDERRRVIHLATAWHILERYRKDKGNSQAAVSYLQKATGFTRGSVATATADLVEWGYFDRVMGAGKRPTEYIPKWSLVLSSQDANSVLPSQDESVLQRQDAKTKGVLRLREESPLVSPLTEGLTLGTPSAGTDAGLSAAPCGEGDFDLLYDEFGVHRDYRKAKSEFEKTNVDIGILLSAARRWRKCYDDMGREQQFRKSLATWLRDECWREDGPANLPSKKRKSATKPATTAVNDNHDEGDDVKISQKIPSPPRRIGTRASTIASAREESSHAGCQLILTFADGGARSFYAEAADAKKQASGQRELAMLSEIAGTNIEVAAQLEGLKFSLTEYEDGSAKWEAA